MEAVAASAGRMDRNTTLSAEATAAMEAVAASIAVLSGFARPTSMATADHGDPLDSRPDDDALRQRVGACLEGLAEVARLEARIAALKAQLTSGCAS